jgi:hypothetical protein
MPTFTSPFDWRLVVRSSNAYDLRDMSLTDERLRAPAAEGEVLWRESVRFPNLWTPATRRAAATPLGQIFLGFARFPDARTFADRTGTVVRFSDMRFAAGLVAIEQPVRRPSPFSVTIRLAPDGRVLDESVTR